MLPMNRLSRAKRVQISNLLCEGNSVRATNRIDDVSANTVTKLLVDTMKARSTYQDRVVRAVPRDRYTRI